MSKLDIDNFRTAEHVISTMTRRIVANPANRIEYGYELAQACTVLACSALKLKKYAKEPKPLCEGSILKHLLRAKHARHFKQRVLCTHSNAVGALNLLQLLETLDPYH